MRGSCAASRRADTGMAMRLPVVAVAVAILSLGAVAAGPDREAALELRVAQLERRLARVEALCGAAAGAGDGLGADRRRLAAAASRGRGLAVPPPGLPPAAEDVPLQEGEDAAALVRAFPSSEAVRSLGLGEMLIDPTSRQLQLEGPEDDAIVVEQPGASLALAGTSGNGTGAATEARLRALGVPAGGYNHTAALRAAVGPDAVLPAPSALSALVSSSPLAAPNVAAIASALAAVVDSMGRLANAVPRLAAFPGEIRAFAAAADGLPRGWVPADGRCFAAGALPTLFERLSTTFTPYKPTGCAEGTPHASKCTPGSPVDANGTFCGVPPLLVCGMDPRVVLLKFARNRTFCVPDLRGRSVVGGSGDPPLSDALLGSACVQGSSCSQATLLSSETTMPAAAGLSVARTGFVGGTQTRTLTQTNLPAHAHSVEEQLPASTTKLMYLPSPSTPDMEYCADSFTCDLGGFGLSRAGQLLATKLKTATVGGGQPIDIQDPYVALTWAIFTGA